MYYPIVIIVTLILSLTASLRVLFLKEDFIFLKKREFSSRFKNSIIWWLVIIYFVVFSFFSIVKYNAYNMPMIDLGRMDQAIWNTLHGRILFGTFDSGNVCRLVYHSEFIYILIAPLYLFFSSPKTILVLQSLVISLGAFAVLWLAREKLRSYFAALCFACAYLLYPSLQYGNLLDFHSDMLATTLLLFTFFYLEKEKWFKYFTFLLLSLMCKEYISLIVVMLGIYIFIAKRKNTFAAITILLGTTWFFMTYKFIPSYLQGRENRMVEYYAHLGSSTEIIFKNILLHPVNMFAKFLTFHKISIFSLLLLPVGFLPLLNPHLLILSLPILIGLVLLSPTFSFANHHNGTIIPFIFISSIGAAQYLADKLRHRFKNITYALGIFVVLTALISNIFYGPSPLSWRFWNKASYNYWGNLHQFRITPHDRIADRFVKQIPQKVAVSASNHLASHLSQRETIYQFPHPKDFRGIDYLVVDLLEYFPTCWNLREDETNTLKGVFLNRNFTLKSWGDGILLFQKDLKKEEGYYMKASVVKSASAQHIVNYAFNNRLLLLGYDFDYKNLKLVDKYRLIYYWKVLDGFDKKFVYRYFDSTEDLNKDFILIDTFKKDNQEIHLLHLPTFILYPPKEWKKGDIIKEEIEFSLPDYLPAGNYIWKIGLYVAPQFYFIQTEEKGLVPGTKEMKFKTVEFKSR